MVVEPEGWRPEVAARTHGRLEQGRPVFGGRGEFDNFLAPGDGDPAAAGKELPGFVGPDSFFAGVDGFVNLDLFLRQELPGFFTGGSAFAHVGPVDGHGCGSVSVAG